MHDSLIPEIHFPIQFIVIYTAWIDRHWRQVNFRITGLSSIINLFCARKWVLRLSGNYLLQLRAPQEIKVWRFVRCIITWLYDLKVLLIKSALLLSIAWLLINPLAFELLKCKLAGRAVGTFWVFWALEGWIHFGVVLQHAIVHSRGGTRHVIRFVEILELSESPFAK